MKNSPLTRPEPRIELLAPPYTSLRTITTDWRPSHLPLAGNAIVWWLVDASKQEQELEWLYTRPAGIPLFIILPPPRFLDDVKPIFRHLAAARPKAVLPTCDFVSPERLKKLLIASPRELGAVLASYLDARGLFPDPAVYEEVKCALEIAPQTRTIARLSRRLSTSRRTLGRHFLNAGLPVPSHLLQFSRLLHVAVRLQNENVPISRLISSTGYPDVFTMSNQMKRLIGCRPSEVRRCLGWEWIVESWLATEARAGGIDRERHWEVIAPYLTELDESSTFDWRDDDEDLGGQRVPVSD